MTIAGPDNLRRIELACNSAAMFHIKSIDKVKDAIDPQFPEKELVDTLAFHEKELDAYLVLSNAALIQQETMSIHEKAKG